jgi:FkbM family methyltransferase
LDLYPRKEKLVKLVISTSMANLSSLAGVIADFSKANALLWLGKTSHSVSLSAPTINNLEDLPATDEPVFVVAPAEECVLLNDISRRFLRVIERGAEETSGLATVRVDQFDQLKYLLTLAGYTGLSRLLVQRDWQAEDYRAAILKRYAPSLERLRVGRTGAIFGAQRLGQLVVQSLQSQDVTVQAFIDNSPEKHGTLISNIPVRALSQISDRELPVIIATTKYSNSIAQQLRQEGFKHILPYSVMSLVDPVLYPDEIPYIGIQEDFAHHAAEYVGLFLCLSDDKSRDVLDGLINYRLDYDTRKASDVADEYSRQYFDADLIKFSGDDVFVDLGGYDGDTAEKFIEYGAGKYRKIYLFEPDEKLLKASTVRLNGCKHIEYIQAGAYSKDGELRFATTGRTNGSISEAGELVIPVRKIDSIVSEPPTLIKMDIEGSESEALKGAAKLLRTVRPRLAIAAYHFAPDLWRLADVVRGLNPSYRFYLRHYSETGLESVIYAL